MSEHICSFCGKDSTQAGRMVRGMGNVCICDGCVSEAREITEPEPEGGAILQRTLINTLTKGIGLATSQAAEDARAWAEITAKLGAVLVMAHQGVDHTRIRAMVKEISDLEYNLTLDCKATGDTLELWPHEDEDSDDSEG